MRVQGNGPCIFPRRKQILREVDARDVVVMRSFGEKKRVGPRCNHASSRPAREYLVSDLWETGFECFTGCPCGNGSLRVACP